MNVHSAAECIAIRAAFVYVSQSALDVEEREREERERDEWKRISARARGLPEGKKRRARGIGPFLNKLRSRGMREILVAEVYATHLEFLSTSLWQRYLETSVPKWREEAIRLHGVVNKMRLDLDSGIVTAVPLVEK